MIRNPGGRARDALRFIIISQRLLATLIRGFVYDVTTGKRREVRQEAEVTTSE